MWETLEMMLAESIIEYEMNGRRTASGWAITTDGSRRIEAYKAAGNAEQWVTIAGA